MSLTRLVRDMQAEAGRDMLAKISNDLHDDVSRLRDRLAQIDCATRMNGAEPHYLAAIHAYARAGLDAITHAADQAGAVSLMPQDLQQAEEASHR